GRLAERLQALRERYLIGTAKVACAGPSEADDVAWRGAILAALKARRRAVRRAKKRIEDAHARSLALARARSAYLAADAAARARLTQIDPCGPPGTIPGTDAFSIIGRFPTASYPVDVEVTPNGGTLVWLAARGLGTGPNPNNESIKELLKGRVGVLPTPTDQRVRDLTPRANQAVHPANFVGPPPNTPVVGPDGGASTQI